jgi:hypothetical protein
MIAVGGLEPDVKMSEKMGEQYVSMGEQECQHGRSRVSAGANKSVSIG